MHIVVLLKMVPDVVEDLEIAAGGRALDLDYLRMIPSESDDHALEQALILKERHGGKVSVIALDAPEVDDALFTAMARGADRAVKLTGTEAAGTRGAAHAFVQALREVPGLMPADLILTGVQAIDDLDGLVAPMAGHELGLPYLGIITQVDLDMAAGTAVAVKEYPGSVRGEFELKLPAVLGIQAAEKPPRYVPVAKVRAAMKSQRIDCAEAAAPADGSWPPVEVVELKKPEAAGRAVMLEGDPDTACEALCEVLAARGLL